MLVHYKAGQCYLMLTFCHLPMTTCVLKCHSFSYSTTHPINIHCTITLGFEALPIHLLIHMLKCYAGHAGILFIAIPSFLECMHFDYL
ncbi:hypothetical protein EB796_021430 [Bugula neritina]|uniref:Uncharacterized protein n=1 Tax=Bugula neritina TaxID=10212 RepID=A0A7J7J4A6_BUGNE|nr:hypothetical protein EB796_021430 [Bugula neritina]